VDEHYERTSENSSIKIETKKKPGNLNCQMYGWRRPYCNPGMLETKYICHDHVGLLSGHVGDKILNVIGQQLKQKTTAKTANIEHK